MANAPIKVFKKGKISLCQWSGEYQGKPTTSYSLTKRVLDPKTNQWSESKYLSVTDIMDIQALCAAFLTETIIKNSNQQAKQQPAKQQSFQQSNAESFPDF